MTCPYEANPFAGVICKICQYPIRMKHNLFVDIHLHERRNRNHFIASSPDQRKLFSAALQQQIADVGISFANIRNDEGAIFEESSQYLCFPAARFHVCSQCDKCIFDRRTHKGGRHCRYCVTTELGFTVKNWTKNDPRIIPHIFDIRDKSIFLEMFLPNTMPQLTSLDVRVTQGNITTNRASLEQTLTPTQLALDRILEEQNARYKVDVAMQTVEIIDQSIEPNLWIGRVGYDKHLKGLIRMDLYELAKYAPKEEEIAVARILERITKVMEKSVEYSKSIDRSNLVLFVVKRIDFRPALKPFNPNLGKETWDRYIHVLGNVVTIIIRIESIARHHNKRRYQLTEKQSLLIHRIIYDVDDVEPEETYVEALLSLLCQPIQDQSYESALLSALAMMSIQKDGVFRGPNETTQFYAALMASYRSLILYSGKHFPVHVESMGGKQSSLISNVRQLTEILMCHPEQGIEPGPMSWILNSFSYAKAICRETVMPGVCYWDDDILVFKNVHFSISDLCQMMSQLVSKTKDSLATLLFLRNEYTSNDFPTIPWNKLVDDIGDCTNGYSFLTEPQNEWIRTKENYLFNKMRNSVELSSEWYNSEQNTIDERALRQYGQSINKFRENLLVLIHITSGQPARGTEITNLRFVNSSTPRNVCIDRGVVCIRTVYHKMMQQTGKGKHIYRYLPVCVGELLVYYLWLVLPFWQTTNGSFNGSTEKSIYLWSKELSFPEAKTISSEDLWNSTKLSNVLTTVFRTFMGVAINISMWRHIAVAISRRFLKRAFTDPSDDDGDADEDNEEFLKNLDVLFDLQMAHSTAVANRVYAPLMNQSMDTLMNIIDAYRHICCEWHTLLFPELKRSKSRKNDVDDLYRSFMLRIRMRRLQLLASIDACCQLRQLVNNVVATFRGNQQEVIEAIIRADACVLQVAPTGIGKSVSFLLPSFAAKDGTTVVIVPLVSLQKDMVRRCKNMGISAVIWDAYQICVHSTLVFVTPESAVTKAFLQYMTTLLYSHKLDRIVIDECHTVLSGSDDFRPKLQAIREIVRFTGVQLLLLTATLPPSQEKLLFDTLGIPSERVTVYRDATTRSNIRYIVQSSLQRDEIISIVTASVKSHIRDGKCIIYCRSISDGKYISSKLDWPFYHSAVGSAYDKEIMLRDFVSTGSVIVATNALGLGIDIPNVRLILHMGSPKSLLDFSQESGRAGRDGFDSVSILLHMNKFQIDGDMYSFIHTDGCRRGQLDRTMDGVHRIGGCRENELLCDRCSLQRNVEETNMEQAENDGGFDVDNVMGIDDDELVRMCDEVVAVSKSRKHDMATASMLPPSKKIIIQEVERRLEYRREQTIQQNEFDHCKDMLEEIANSKCIICTLNKSTRCGDECSNLKKLVSARCRSMTNVLRFPKYSACFLPGCYVPQAICKHWAETSNGFQATSSKCQYRYVLLNTIYSITALDPEMKGVLDEMVATSGMKDVGSFFTKAVRWHGLQTTHLFVSFYKMLCIFKLKKK